VFFGIPLGCGLDDRGSGSRFRFSVGAGNFSLYHRVQTGSGAHPASYPMDIRGSSPGVKRPGSEADYSPPSSAVKECVELYLHSPSTPRGVVLSYKKTQGKCYLLTYLLTHSLTPWCRILFEKLIVTQLVKKLSCFLMEPAGSLPCPQKPATGPYLSQLNPVRPIDPYVPKVHLP
jgi:hypothetical protein